MKDPEVWLGILALGFIAFVIAVKVTIMCFMLWLGGSTLTSGIKAVTGHCGERYPIESILSGDWFCADKAEPK